MATVVGDTSLVFTYSSSGSHWSDSQGGLYEGDNFQTKKSHVSSCLSLSWQTCTRFLCVFLGQKQRKVPKVLASTDEKSAKQRWDVFCASKIVRIGSGLHENLLFWFIAKGDDAGNYQGFFLRGMMSWRLSFSDYRCCIKRKLNSLSLEGSGLCWKDLAPRSLKTTHAQTENYMEIPGMLCSRGRCAHKAE